LRFKFIPCIAILLILFVGFAGAVTIPEPTYNFGPSAGFKNAATIQASDLYAEDDFKVGDDAQIVGDLAITGASSFASLYLSSGLNVAGTSALNVTTATSVTATGTIRGEQLTSTDDALVYGTLTANDVVSNTTIAASDITASDDAIITDDLTVDGAARIDETLTVNAISCNGTVAGADLTASDDVIITDDLVVDGAARIDEASTIASLIVNTTLDTNGEATFENVSLTQNKRLTFNTAGTGYIQWLTSGNYMTIKGNPQFDDGYTWSGTASPSSGSDLTAIGGASDIDYSLSSGIFSGPTGQNSLNGNVAITGTKTFMVNNGAATFGSSVTAASGVINGTMDINGATTTAAITVDSGSIVTADQYKRRTVTTATNYTILDGGADVYLVGNGTGVNTQTILFPTAADNVGRIITVIVATDPLANTVILDGENSETIDGAATKTTTDAVGTMYHLVCNGVGWISAASTGSWS
jgi:uncharacterized Zn ribbon protein